MKRLLPAAPQDPAGYPIVSDPDTPASGGLLEYVRILRRRKGTVFLVTFLFTLAGFLYTLPKAPIYQARTTIEIQGINENFLNMGNVNPTQSTSIYYPEIDLQTQVRVLQSASLIDRVVKALANENKPLVVPETRLSAWRQALGLTPSTPPGPADVLSGTAAGLKIRTQPNTRLIEISCDSSSPQIASDFANRLTAEFIEQNLASRWQTTQRTGEFLNRQMEDIKIKLEKSEEALQSYARQTGLLFTAEKDNVAEERLKQLQEELSRAQAERVSRQARYELASSASTDSLAEVLDDNSLKSLQDKLTDLRREHAELSSALTASHPRVRRVQAQINSLEPALQRSRNNIVGRIRSDFISAQRRERLLSADYSSQARLMSAQADQVSHYNILKREVDTSRQLYESMLQRVKEAGVASALRASNIRVVDPAKPPALPYKPSILANSAVGLLAGLFFGFAFVVFRNRTDRTIQDPGDSQMYLGIVELGIIPSADTDRYRRRLQPPLPAPTPNQLAVVTRDRAPTIIAECFRNVLTSILFAGHRGDHPRVLVFSSTCPREGKTTVVSNLAIALAEINKRVVLIDGDMRRPRIHEIFDLKNDIGLGDVLRQPVALNGHPIAEVQRTSVPNLSVLTSGSATAIPNLIHSLRFSELIANLRNDFDMVLIDTPPMLQMSDARVMARHADAVVLVVRANQTTRDAAQIACQKLTEDGTRVLGTVLNDWNPAHTAAYGYNKYCENYYQYHDTK